MQTGSEERALEALMLLRGERPDAVIGPLELKNLQAIIAIVERRNKKKAKIRLLEVEDEPATVEQLSAGEKDPETLEREEREREEMERKEREMFTAPGIHGYARMERTSCVVTRFYECRQCKRKLKVLPKIDPKRVMTSHLARCGGEQMRKFSGPPGGFGQRTLDWKERCTVRVVDKRKEVLLATEEWKQKNGYISEPDDDDEAKLRKRAKHISELIGNNSQLDSIV